MEWSKRDLEPANVVHAEAARQKAAHTYGSDGENTLPLDSACANSRRAGDSGSVEVAVTVFGKHFKVCSRCYVSTLTDMTFFSGSLVQQRAW